MMNFKSKFLVCSFLFFSFFAVLALPENVQAAAVENSVCLNGVCTYSTLTSAIGATSVSSTVTTTATYNGEGETFPWTMATSGVSVDCSASDAILNNNGASEAVITLSANNITVQSCKFFWTKFTVTGDTNTIQSNTFTANSSSTIFFNGTAPTGGYAFNNTGLNGISIDANNTRVVSNTVDIYVDTEVSYDKGIVIVGSAVGGRGIGNEISLNTINNYLNTSYLSLIEVGTASSTIIASNTLRYNTALGGAAIIIDSDPVGALIYGNKITLPSNPVTLVSGIEIYPYVNVVRAEIYNNSINIPSTCALEGGQCKGIRITDGHSMSGYNATFVTSTYNLIYANSSLTNTGHRWLSVEDGSAEVAPITIYDDYNGFYNINSAGYTGSTIVSSTGGHTINLDPILMSTVTSSINYLQPAPVSNYLDINGSRDIGVYSGARENTIYIDDDEVINYDTIDATSTAILTNVLRTGDTVNLAAGTYSAFSLTTSTLATSTITIDGVGATTIINAGANQNAIALTGFADSTIKDLAVQNASSSVSTYDINYHGYTYNGVDYDNISWDGPAESGFYMAFGTSFKPMELLAISATTNISDYLNGSDWFLGLARCSIKGGITSTIYFRSDNFANETAANAYWASIGCSGYTMDYWATSTIQYSGGTYILNDPSGASEPTGIINAPTLSANTTRYSGVKLSNTSGVTIENVTSTNSSYGVWFNGNTASTNVSSSVFSGNTYDIYSDSTGNNNLKNSSFNTASSSVASTGNVDAYFKARAYVADGGVPKSGASVNFVNAQNSTTTLSTGGDGFTVFTADLLAYTMTSSSPTSTTGGGYNPYTVSITAFDTYATTSTSANLASASQLFTLALTEAAPANSAPAATTPYPIFSTSSTGIVTVTTTVSDANADSVTLFVDYSLDSGSTWASTTIATVIGTGTFTTSTGQISGISTASGNALTFTWDSESAGVTTTVQAVIRLRPYDSTDYGTSVTSSDFTIDNEAPAAPTSFTFSAVTTSSLVLTWAEVSGASTYTVSSTATSSPFITSATTTSFTDLASETVYYTQVLSTDAYGNASAYSTLQSTTTLVVAPSAPTGFATSSIAATSVSFVWNDVSGETSYILQGSTNGTDYSNLTTYSTNATSGSLGSLTPNTHYWARLVASNSGGDSSPSDVIELYTLAAAPGTPAISDVSTSSLSLTWAASSNPGTTIYTVLYSGGTVTTTDVSRAFTGLTPNTNYQFQVKAENLGAAGTYSAYSASSTVTTTIPVDVTSPIITAVSSSTLTISWTDGVNGGTPVYQVSSPDNSFASVTASTITKNLTGLTPSSTYTFTVKVQKPDSTYTTGVAAAATTTLASDPTTPTASSVTSSSLVLSWGANNNPATVVYRISGDNGISTVTTTVVSSSFSGLTINTGYTFTVAAQNADGTYTSGVSSLIYTLPSAPTGLAATAASVSQINLSWTAVTGATSYKVYSSADSYTTAVSTPSTNSASITGLSASTAYTYKVSAVNTSGEGEKSDLATATTNAAPAGGGGGGSVVSAPSAPTTVAPAVISQEFSIAGENYIVVGNVEHKIQVNKVSVDNVVTLTVESTPITITLKVGEEKLLDTNNDTVSDFYLKLNGINTVNKTIDLTIKSIADMEFSINGGLSATANRNVILYFNSPQAKQLALSSNEDFGGKYFVDYKPTYNWTLPAGDGKKTICVKFRTVSGGEKVICSSIVLTGSGTTADDNTVAPTISESIVAAPIFTRTLKLGSTGTDVKQLQTFLKQKGYFTYSYLTTYFGSYTRTALIKFQKANSLAQTGILDAATRVKIEGLMGTQTKNVTTKSTGFIFTRTLKLGSTGTDVKQLQTFLKQKGYFTYPYLTTYFGSYTRTALIKFQKANSLAQTGILDAATRVKIQNIVNE